VVLPFHHELWFLDRERCRITDVDVAFLNELCIFNALFFCPCDDPIAFVDSPFGGAGFGRCVFNKSKGVINGIGQSSLGQDWSEPREILVQAGHGQCADDEPGWGWSGALGRRMTAPLSSPEFQPIDKYRPATCLAGLDPSGNAVTGIN
jgi:hypothetical protein